MARSGALLLLVLLGELCTVLVAQNGDQCFVYYGGMVFPEETRRTVEHGMHWSKTQSLDDDGYPSVLLANPTAGNTDIGSELVRRGLAKGPQTASPAVRTPVTSPPAKSYQQQRPTSSHSSQRSTPVHSGSPLRDRVSENSSQKSQSAWSTPLQSPRGSVQPSPARKQASKSRAYSSVSLTRGKSVDVIVTHISSLTSFTCQVQASASELQELMESIGKHCTSSNTRAVSSPAPNMSVLALYSLDECWYRAIIDSVDPSGKHCTVSFMDYGDSENLPIAKLQQVPPRFFKLPTQALQCSLHGLPSNYTSSSDAIDALSDLVLEQRVSAVPKNPLKGRTEGWEVDLTTSEGVNVLKELIQLGHVSKTGTPKSPVHKPAVDLTSPLPQPVLPVGTPVDVVVSFLISPAHFYLQLMESRTTLERIASGMQSAYQNPKARIGTLVKPEVGSPCAAQFSEDKLWYRCRVKSIQGSRALVYYVDYGNSEQVNVSDLKLLQKDFVSDPCGAIPCSLAGLPEEVSSEEVIARFEGMVFSENCKLVAEFSRPLSLSAPDSPIPVQLIDSKRSGTKDVAKILFAQGGIEKRSPPLLVVPPVKPPLSSLCECVVAHVVSPDELYCQLLTDNTLDTLVNDLYTFYGESDKGSKITKPTNGMYCAAPYVDGSWYRGLVTAVLPGDLVDVLYIDYGNRSQVKVQDMRKLESQFTTQPAQAVRCCLAGITPPSGSWSEDCCSKLTESLLEQEVSVMFLASAGENRGYEVQVQLGGNDIAGIFVKAGLAVKKVTGREQPSKAPDAPRGSPRAAPSSKPSISAFHLEVGQHCEVICTASTSPLEFYCQIPDDSLNTLMSEIAEYCLKAPPPTFQPQWSPGDVALGQFSEDQEWYRATITKVLDGGSRLEVRYVDYGNMEELRPTSLKAITPAFCQLPAFAIPCSLEGASNRVITPEGASAFNSLILDGEFQLRCVGSGNDSQSYRVELKQSGDGASVLTLAVNQGILQQQAVPPPTKAAKSRPESDLNLIIPTMFPQVDDRVPNPVNVVHCESPSLFYCQFATGTSVDALTDLMAQLQETYGSGSIQPLRPTQLSVGMFVAAQFSEDDMWYRAQVNRVANDMTEVTFVDYGNAEVLPVAKVCPIAREFTHLPSQGIPCSLASVTPLVGSEWSGESTDGFLNLMEEAVVARAKSAREQSGRKFSFGDGKTLTVSLAFSSTGEDVATELVRQGFAKGGEIAGAPEPKQPSVGTTVSSRQLSAFPVTQGWRGEVYISHIETPFSFWVQASTADEPLNELAEALAAAYNSTQPQRLHHPKVGDACCAKFSEDQNWYRGIVQSCDGAMCHVHFVDYGNSESVNTVDVQCLQPQFFDVPAQSISCSLAGCSPLGGTSWTDEAISSFSSLTANLALDAECVSCGPQGKWKVKLSSEGGKDVASQMVEMGLASASGQKPALQRPGESAAVEVPELTMVVGQSYPMYMTHVISPSEFYCQLATQSQILDELMARVADYYTEHKPRAIVEVGCYCAAQYSGNNAWYRAKILKVNSPDNVVVYFVDYGNSEVVTTDQIRALQPEFTTLPSQAILMSLTPEVLANIQPEQLSELDLEQEFQVTPITVSGVTHIVDIQGDAASTLLLNPIGSSLSPPTTPSNAVVAPGECPPLVYPLGATVDVYVSHVNSPSSFYCQPLERAGELDEMMTLLVDHVASSPPKQLKNPSPGQFCLAQYSADGEWYRARINSFPSEADVLVTFVDYGNSELMPRSGLCVAPDSLLATQTQAIHCTVFEDVDAGWTWGEGKVEAFTSQVMNEAHFTLTIMGQGDDDRYTVEMSSNSHSIDFSHLLSGEEGLAQPAPVEIPNNILAAATFRPIPPNESSLHPSAEISLVAVKGSKTPSTEAETESDNGGEEGEGEGEPLIRAPYMMSLGRQEVFEASVVHVQSPSLLFLQKVDCQPLMDTLAEEMEHYCASFPGRGFQHFRAGDLVLAKYSLDEAWYRAKVIEVQPSGSADVSFIDYGNVEIVDPQDMIMCPENFLDLPAQAISCSLAHVPRREEDWPEGYKELIDGLVADRVMRATVVVPGGQGMRATVTLEDLESGTDVSGQVLAKLQEECEGGYTGLGVDAEFSETNEVIDAAATPDSETTVLSKKTTTVRPILPKRTFEVGSSHEVYLVSCASPHSFICQLTEDEETIDSITTGLAQIYSVEEEEGRMGHPLGASPVDGDIVCSQFSEDGQWYRARVVGGVGEEREVVYLDFGNSETVPLASLRELDQSLAVHPPMALECFLHGVESPGKDGHFDETAASKIMELVGEEAATIEISSVDSTGHLGVQLHNSEELDVGAALITANLAIQLLPTPQTTPSTVTQPSLSEERMHADDQTPTVHSSKQGAEKVTPEVENESPIPEQTVPTTSQPESLPNRPVLPKRTFEVGSSHEVYLVSCATPHSFICQLTEDEDTINSITTGLAQIYTVEEEEGRMGHPLGAAPVDGDIVCSKFSEDGQWYRAQVVGGAGEEREVVYLDFGNHETVPLASLCELDQSLAVHPPMALQCFLHGVESPGKDGNFDDAAATRITELVGEEAATVEIFTVDSTGHLGVQLRNSEGVDMGAALITASLAIQLLPTLQTAISTVTQPSLSEETPTVHDSEQGAEKVTPEEENEISIPKQPVPLPSTPVLPKRTFKVGSSHEVYLVSCTSPHSFICQLTEDEETIDSITASLAQIYTVEEEGGRMGHPLGAAPVDGDIVCAQFSEDGQWYRAQVVGGAGEEREVVYVDFGNHEMVPLASLCELDQSLAVHPPMALQCFLHGVESPGKDGNFDEAAATRITELVGEEAVTLEIASLDSTNHLGVTLRNSEGVDVAADLIGANLASQVSSTSQTTATVTQTSVSGEDAHMSEPAQAVYDEEEPIGQAIAEEDQESFGVEAEPDDSPTSSATCYPRLSLPVGSKVPVAIVSVTSPDEFIGQLTSEADTVLSLLDAIASEGYEIGDGNLLIKVPKPGLPVCACFTEDDSWYRAKVISLGKTPDTVTVQFVDYGNSETLTLDRIKQLQAPFADPLPPQAITCSLPVLTEHDLNPGVPTSNDPWELEWSPSCTDHLSEVALNKEGLYLEVVASKPNGSFIVKLLDTSGGEEVDIRESLVAKLREAKPQDQSPEEDEDEFHDAESEMEPGGGEVALDSKEAEVDEDSFQEASEVIDRTEPPVSPSRVEETSVEGLEAPPTIADEVGEGFKAKKHEVTSDDREGQEDLPPSVKDEKPPGSLSPDHDGGKASEGDTSSPDDYTTPVSSDTKLPQLPTADDNPPMVPSCDKSPERTLPDTQEGKSDRLNEGESPGQTQQEFVTPEDQNQEGEEGERKDEEERREYPNPDGSASPGKPLDTPVEERVEDAEDDKVKEEVASEGKELEEEEAEKEAKEAPKKTEEEPAEEEDKGDSLGKDRLEKKANAKEAVDEDGKGDDSENAEGEGKEKVDQEERTEASVFLPSEGELPKPVVPQPSDYPTIPPDDRDLPPVPPTDSDLPPIPSTDSDLQPIPSTDSDLPPSDNDLPPNSSTDSDLPPLPPCDGDQSTPPSESVDGKAGEPEAEEVDARVVQSAKEEDGEGEQEDSMEVIEEAEVEAESEESKPVPEKTQGDENQLQSQGGGEVDDRLREQQDGKPYSLQSQEKKEGVREEDSFEVISPSEAYTYPPPLSITATDRSTSEGVLSSSEPTVDGDSKQADVSPQEDQAGGESQPDLPEDEPVAEISEPITDDQSLATSRKEALSDPANDVLS